MSRIDITQNPLANVVYDELGPILEAIYIAAENATDAFVLEGGRCGGIERIEGSREFRPSTDDECFQVQFDLFPECATFDARKPLFGQLSSWLKELADGIEAARAEIERIQGVRDVVIAPRKKAG
jgi:hypothetical protein